MDEFIMEVDNNFRVSMADSTMMCILHSAMNKAHAKVQSKDGIIERLNEQSKFYELAIMQLEACLKFVQEEAGNYILETTHKRLLFDLLEMKDKLEERLKETELAIVEKDKELIERSTNETRLQQILKAKEKELQRHQKSDYSKINENISELKYKIDQHVWNIKQHLEGERIALTTRLSQDSSLFTIIGNIEHVEDFKSQPGANRENNYVMEIDKNFECTHEFITGFDHMGLEIDSLKKTLDTTFETISMYDDNPREQQWLRMIENDILTIFLKEFVEIQNKDLQVKINNIDNNLVSTRPLYIQTWSNFINDVTLLRDDLEKVKFSYEEREKDMKIHDSYKEIIIHDDKLWQHVHEDFEKEKSDTEKSKPCLNEYEAIIKYIAKNFLRKMDEIMNWMISLNSSFSNDCVNHEKSKIRDKKNVKDPNYKDLIARHHYEVEQHMKMLNLRFLVANNSKDLTHDYDIRLDEYMVQILTKEDVYTNFLKEIIKEMRLNKEKNSIELSGHLEECTFVSNINEGLLCLFLKEFINECKARTTRTNILCTREQGGRGISQQVHQIQDLDSQLHILIQEELKMIYLKEMLNLWNLQCVDYTYEFLIRECIQWCVVSEAIKHCELLSNKSSNITHLKGVDSFINELSFPLSDFEIEKIKISQSLFLLYAQGKSGVLRNENSHLKLTCIEVIGNNSDKAYDGLKMDKYVPSMEFSSTLKKALLQLDEFKAKLREMKSDDIIKSEQIDFEKVQEEVKYALPSFRLTHVDSSCNQIFYTKDNKSPPLTSLNENNEDLLCAQVFYDIVDNCRNMLQEKLAQSYSRLEKMNDHVKILTHEIMYIKREKMIYKTAFIQRCQNLQKAEIEVDFLGDTVEAFTTILQRIYSTLNHYSIVLQNFPEVLNMRNWIENLIPIKDDMVSNCQHKLVY